MELMHEEGERHTGRVGQVKIYLGKQFRMFVHEKGWKVLIMAAVIAYMVAYVVGSNMFVNMEGTKIGSLAFVCCCIWNGFFNSIQVVCREREIIKREHRTGLHISSYIAAHMIYQAFLCILQVVISLAVYAFAGISFPSQGMILPHFMPELAISLFLITYASDMMALMVSCIVRTATSAMTVMPFLLIVQLVFAGVAFPLHGLPEKISSATISKWGIYLVCTEANYNALPSIALTKSLKQFEAIPAVKEVYEALSPENRLNLEYYTAQYMTVDNYKYETGNILKEWGILLAFALAYAGIGMLFLEFVDHDKR